MILQAIIAQLKTGSISGVFTRGNYETYANGKDVNDLLSPYVLVFNDFPVNPYYEINNTVDAYLVEAHFPTGNITELSEYIENELVGLLHRKRLVDNYDSATYNFQVYLTMAMSIMSEPNDDKSISGGNDDGSISRYRRIIVPRRGL